jgi:hypothetical protein
MITRNFRTKASDRWGDSVSPEGVLDMALRGTQDQWWEIYEIAREDLGFRQDLRRLLERSDPDLCGAARLWTALLDRFDAGSATADQP